jgi:tRNA U34 5-carboxymethylaminomethyl modifying GTPase MnmE/TrmE
MGQILENLKDTKKSLMNHPVDLVLEKFHNTLKLMDMIIGTGKEYNFLDELFRKFCIGK